MTIIRNPFITSGYVSSDYFCDREKESETLIREISNGNNLALISTRRMGKTGLIQHCFRERKIRKDYYTFFIDIYATKSLRDFVFALSKEILEELKPSGKKALQLFWKSVKSLHTSVSFDINGTPSLSLGLGDIQAPATTLDEIFHYLNHADKPCLVAIDEFQQIAGYAEDNVEATLRTYVQHCSNAHFIFAGSQRHIMGNMFLTPSRPFYQSVSMMHLESIPLAKYTAFAQLHFAQAGKSTACWITGIVIAALIFLFVKFAAKGSKPLEKIMLASGCVIVLLTTLIVKVPAPDSFNPETGFSEKERRKDRRILIRIFSAIGLTALWFIPIRNTEWFEALIEKHIWVTPAMLAVFLLAGWILTGQLTRWYTKERRTDKHTGRKKRSSQRNRTP